MHAADQVIHQPSTDIPPRTPFTSATRLPLLLFAPFRCQLFAVRLAHAAMMPTLPCNITMSRTAARIH